MYSAALAALAAWWASASTATLQPDPVPAPPQLTAAEKLGESLEHEISRLREHKRVVAEPQRPSRNLFRFAASPHPDTPQLLSDVPPFAGRRPDAVPPPLALALIGLAQDEGPEGTVRTAIISGGGDLFIVKEGDPVTSRFRVSRISGEVVELVGADDAFLRLALK
jgi:hypothetical protein